MSDSQDVKKILDIETPPQEDNISKEAQNILKDCGHELQPVIYNGTEINI